MREKINLVQGEVLIEEGGASDCMYLLKEGTLAVFKQTTDGQKQIGTIYPGEFVGEVSFLDNRPRCATVKSIGESEVEVFDAHKFQAFLYSQPKWLQTMMRTLADRLRTTNEKIKV